MYSITMTQTCCVQTFAIIIHTHTTIHNLVLAISIHIGNSQVMISLTRKRIITVLAIKYPTGSQLAAAPIPSSQNSSSIITSTHYHTRVNAIQISNTSQESIYPVAITIIAAVATFTSPTTKVSPAW